MSVSSKRKTSSGPAGRLACRTHGRTRGLLLAGCICLWGLAAPVPHREVRAQEPKIQSLPKVQAQKGKDETQEDKVLKQRLNMSEVEILGEVEKPKTMFVIPRSPHEYSWESSRKDFTEEILAPMSKRKMKGLQQWREESGQP